jgi:hypothetical protein
VGFLGISVIISALQKRYNVRLSAQERVRFSARITLRVEQEYSLARVF